MTATVYDVIDAELSDIDPLNCWTHARRKWIEALSDNKAVWAYINAHTKLYMKLKLGVEMIVVVLMKDTTTSNIMASQY